MSKIVVKSNNGEEFLVDVQVAMQSNVIKDMMENLKGMDDEKPIFLSEIRSRTFRKILEYCTYHKDDVLTDEDEKTSKERSEDICDWDKEFLNKLDDEMLVKLTKAAHFLDVRGLETICCKHFANQMKGKTLDQIRLMFRFKNTF